MSTRRDELSGPGVERLLTLSDGVAKCMWLLLVLFPLVARRIVGTGSRARREA